MTDDINRQKKKSVRLAFMVFWTRTRRGFWKSSTN